MMILKDRVEIVTRAFDGIDDDGVPVYIEKSTPVPASVTPLGTSDQMVGFSLSVTSRYQVVARASAFPLLDSGGALSWQGVEYEVEGDIEQHHHNGRLRHVEFIAVRKTGA